MSTPTLASNANTTNPGPWQYNAMIRIVTHETHTCKTCAVWARHYTLSALDNELSLTTAERQRETVICSNLAIENTTLQRNHDALQQAHATLQLNSGSIQRNNVTLLRELDVVRVELANTCDDLAGTRRQLNSAEDEIDCLRDSEHDKQTTISDLSEQVDLLKTRLQDIEHEHSQRHRKQPRLASESPTPSRADSPMIEDSAPQPQVVPPLLSRMADPPPAPFTPLPGDTSLAPLTPLDFPMAPRFAASQFYDSVGLYSLHPILSYTSNQYFCTALTGDGDIDFASHALFVYAFGDITAAGPAWTTFLVTREQLTDELRTPAIAANLPLPLTYILGGGRNGVLVSPYKDPKSEEEVNAHFSMDNKAFGYCERIHNTPPELRDAFHQRALDRWLETHDGNPPRRGPSKHNEPSPYDENSVWKRWLKLKREEDTSFKYIGVPHVGQGYQSVHINGAKAILRFIPRALKGPKGPTRTTIKDAFLRAAATLLIVPEHYQHVIEQLGLTIAPNRRAKIYNATIFGDERHLGENEMARFLTSAGVTTNEAESWRPWAAAYTAMEIIDDPSNSHHTESLRWARQRAHELINGDHKWFIKNIPSSSPGYYRPTSEVSRTQCIAPRTAEGSSSSDVDAHPASSASESPTSVSTTAETSPRSVTADTSPSPVDANTSSPSPVNTNTSSPSPVVVKATQSSTCVEGKTLLSTITASTPSHYVAADKDEELVDYGDGLDEDTTMGPA